MTYNNYELDNLDTTLRYEFSITIEEFFEILNKFNKFDEKIKKIAFKWFEEGNTVILPEELLYFTSKIENDYGIAIDDFIYIYHMFEELPEEGKREAINKHGN